MSLDVLPEQPKGYERVVQLLVSHGANVQDKSSPWSPPLHLACLSGSRTVVKLLIDKGANIN